MNLSFAGCGFLGIYHVGVASCFRKYAPHLLLNKISGASAGAIAACCLLLDLPLGETTSDVLRVAIEARKSSLGPFHPSFDVNKLIMEGLEKFLPEDAHIRVSGKLHISLTRCWDGKNVMVSQFDTREELIQVLLASAFIPIFSGLIPPKFKGVRYMDGGYSDNLPTLDENTITVSPFCGESDICPRDDSSQLFHINIANTSIELSKHNIYRMVRILFPPKPEVLANMCKQGFDDALRFLHRNNLINCTKCLAVQSTFVVSETLDEHLVYDPQCKDCKVHRQEALVSNVPDTVLNVFQEVIDTANKGLLNWVFKHRGMKLLSVLSLPYTLPADMVYATLTKVMATAPQVGNTLWDISKVALDSMTNVLHRVNKQRQQISAKIVCQLAITEYGGDTFDIESRQDLAENKLNLNFTVNLDNCDLPLNQSPERKFKTQRILERNPSFTVKKSDTMSDDTFDHIMHVTSQHDAVMHYYYLDENNKVKVTEIYDVTDNDSPSLQTPQERTVNTQLEYDDDLSVLSQIDANRQAIEQHSEYSLEELLEKDNPFSDPESEWTSELPYKVEHPEDEADYDSARVKNVTDNSDSNLSDESDTRPESDQPTSDVTSKILSSKNVIAPLTFDRMSC